MQSASLVPPTLTAFAIIAAAIGASEELVYRGFVWSRLEAFGALGAVGGSVVAHTAYKCALFAGLLISHQINPVTFIFWTICGSLICAILRLASRHVLPSIIAHLVFDVIVYGDCLHAPWWVWG
jgi:membrane protease YdiL (CAAX protease family)